VTVFEADKADATIRALNQASGWLRSKLGRAMRIRSVPELHFHHDSSVETGRHMDDLIDSAIAADRRAPGTDETDAD
jgi:ribosome-binding factor A